MSMSDAVNPRALGLKLVSELREGDKIDLKDSPILRGCPCEVCDRAQAKADAGEKFVVKEVFQIVPLEDGEVPPIIRESMESLGLPLVKASGVSNIQEAVQVALALVDICGVNGWFVSTDTYAFPLTEGQYVQVG